MAKNCTANYKNLSQIQSFSEQMYPTVQWAEQNCKNDEYLKQKTEELEYLTPPAVRKRFSPILLDELNSWGCKINASLDEAKMNTVMFNYDTTEEVIIDFNNFDLIDMDKSNCTFETIPTKTLNSATNTQEITGSQKRACVPMVQSSNSNYSCTNFAEGEWVNSYWYVGYDKSKSYQVRPDWIADMFDEEIPSVVRAQTFTIPNGINNGKLESLDLWIETNGTTNSNWGSPLVVQIWRTTPRSVEKTWWDDNNLISRSYNPKQYETVSWPDGDVRKPLAQSVYCPEKTTPSVQNFLFDKAITVNAGEKYAVVVLSPLSHNEHCPRIGGWGRNCFGDGKYAGGDAFLSEDNGRTFIKYGRTDNNVPYYYGQMTPQDFAFRCHIRTYTSGRDTGSTHYLYLKPISTNPVTEVSINPISVGGNENSNNNLLVFEVSPTGKPNSWMSLDENYKVRFSADSDGEYPHRVFVRAKMKANLPSGSSSTEVTPYIEKFIVNLTLDSPSEMYARTHYYYPKLSPMLGANVWGRIYAPFIAEPSVEGSVEIIQEKLFTEHFTIITAEQLPNYTYIDDDNQLQSIIPGLDVDKITDDDLSVRYQYLMDSPSALNLLKEKGIYVKPYTYVNNKNKTVTHMMGFTDGIQFTNSPAYPIQQCLIQPDGDNRVQGYSEWIDYKFDYDNDCLNFYYESNNDTISNLPIGNLAVSYNPIFIQDLTANEVGRREADEGLILDYFKETFIISDADLENRSVSLRVAAVDPLRNVLLNGEELSEDVDYNVDYINHKINFPVLGDDSTTILNANDVLTVIYTPNLEDTGIAIGYRAKRTNKDKQMIIKPNYIEYKV